MIGDKDNMKNRKLIEAIENVGMVNNIDGQNFDKDFKGIAPVSYADAVLRARAKRNAAKEGCVKHRKVAEETLKKEISNAEHPEPLNKIKVNEEGQITLNESLFESFEDEHVGKADVCPKCGKDPCECNIDESLYPEYVSYQGKKMRVQGIRPDGKYALSEPEHSGLDVTDHPEYLIDVPKEEVEPLEESAEGVKVFRVTYKHSPEIFSSVMVKAANEDEAKQKLSVKKPGKDIVGVSVMSDDEVNDMTNRGMSLMEAKVVDDFAAYEPWDAAVSTFEAIQDAGKMNALEQLIDDMYPDGIDKTELNDLLAYESDWVYSMLDMPNEEDVDEEEDGPAVDFDEEE